MPILTFLTSRKNIGLVLILPILLFGMSACFGYSMGYFSMPYIGEEAPSSWSSSSSSYKLRKMKTLRFQSYDLMIDLNNLESTSNSAWAGPVPIHLDLKNRQIPRKSSRKYFSVTITFYPKVRDIVFYPKLVTLIIDEVSFPLKHSQLSPYYSISKMEKIPETVNKPLSFGEMEEKHSYSIHLLFETIPPSPGKAIQLDVTKAIQVSGQEKGQLIKFKKTRYRHGYT